VRRLCDCDACAGFDDAADDDADAIPDGCDRCPGSADPDDLADADVDGAPDACDRCADGDDALDTDADGLPDDGIAPGTRWEDIPDDFACPTCGFEKAQFNMVQI
jgi:rubredoxin